MDGTPAKTPDWQRQYSSGAPLACNLFSDYAGMDCRNYRVDKPVGPNAVATSFIDDSLYSGAKLLIIRQSEVDEQLHDIRNHHA